MHWEVCIFHTLTQLILMKLYFGGIHFIVPTYSEKNNIIIMNSSSNAFCRQLFMNLNILPIQSQYIYLILLFVTKIKTNFCLTHKYIKSIQGKLLICMYLQQTWQYTKRASIIQELIFTVIFQQPSKIYLVIRINLS